MALTKPMLLLALLVVTIWSQRRYVLIAKQTNNPFFTDVNSGCQVQAEIKEAICDFRGTEDPLPEEQAQLMRDIIEEGGVDGIAISVLDADVMTPVINAAVAAGIPVITYDSDAEDSDRSAAIGTDNFAFGEELGKVLTQLNPLGGYYGIVSHTSPNVVIRDHGVRERLAESKWVEVDYSPLNGDDQSERSLERMYEFAKDDRIQAIIPVGGWPMFGDFDDWKNFVTSNPNLTLVVGDSLPIQVDSLNQGYVNGLVGQLPYQMGQFVVDILDKILDGEKIDETIFGTSLIEMLKFPLVLPTLDLDKNYLGDLVIIGYVSFGIIGFVVIVATCWMIFARATFVVRAAQPIFLGLICLGTLILASTIFPLSIDDEYHSQSQTDAACIAIPWTLSFGFTLIFSALFSKTWRVNQIFQEKATFFVVKVRIVDVAAPMALLLLANSITLLCWTFISPLEYKRRNHDGTDGWNRVISTYGSCVSSDGTAGWVPYLVVLLVINSAALLFALFQVYKARRVSAAFSETNISISFALLLQAFVIGMPLLFLVYDEPQNYYIVWMCLIVVTCLTLLCLIFIPKFLNRNMQRSGNTSTSRSKDGLTTQGIGIEMDD